MTVFTKHLPDLSVTDATARLVTAAVAQAPFAALMFVPDDRFTLIWRNDAHAVLSRSVDADVIGRGMFEAFPPSDDADGAAAMQAIRDAVAEILATREAVEIGPYRYDLQSDSGDYVEHFWRMRMSPVVADDRVTAIMQVAQDVTRVILDRQMSETLRRAASSTAAVSYFSYDPETDHFARMEAVDEMFGFAPGEAGEFAAPFFARVHPDDLQGVRDEVARVFAAPRGEVAAFDYRVPQSDGSERFVRIRAEVARDPVDRREKLVGTFVDLTDVERDRQRLQREVALREALVDEANHRIKNSLAIALAMLRMERNAIRAAGSDGQHSAVSALGALEDRIRAISTAHGLMKLDGDRTDVSLHSLLRQFVNQMRASAGLPESGMRLDTVGPDAPIDSDTAAKLGLILNELVTNALKYGLNEDGEADIAITSETGGDGAAIEIRNRIERERPIEKIASSKLGSMLVAQLSRDFGAQIETRIAGSDFVVRVGLPSQTASHP